MSQAYSMTGFGRGEKKNDQYNVTVEIKSVNNRFREFRFKMSSQLNAIELDLRKKIEAVFKRGTFDISVNYRRIDTQLNFKMDWNKVNQHLESLKKNLPKDIQLTVSPTDFLRNEFYLEEEAKEDELSPLVIAAFDSALGNLKDSRKSEGTKLIKILNDHKAEYAANLKKVIPLKNDYQPQLKEKLLARFKKENSDLKIEEGRFLQEIIYYMEKLDVDEEINRIHAHMEKMDTLFTSSPELGREMEFLLQELGRETNTLGSKSGQTEISSHVVQMKVQLEKMREQALNLE